MLNQSDTGLSLFILPSTGAITSFQWTEGALFSLLCQQLQLLPAFTLASRLQCRRYNLCLTLQPFIFAAQITWSLPCSLIIVCSC